MKKAKLLLISLLAMCLLVTASCGSDTESSSSGASSAPSEAASTESVVSKEEGKSEAEVSGEESSSAEAPSEAPSADEGSSGEAASEESSEDVSDGELKADVFSVEFTADGAINAVTGESLVALGNATTKEVDGKYVGVFDGGSGFSYNDFSNFYDRLTYSVSFEAYFKVQTFDGPYVEILSNMEAGGLGIEVYPDSTTVLAAFLDGDYIYQGGEMNFDEYVHFVATYDGEDVTAYVNGELVAIGSYSSGIKWTDIESAKYLVVGADSSSDGLAHAGMTGEIAVANVYSTALTEEQVLEAYQKATSK